MASVSVIIPTWNGADLLGATLHALERQAFDDFETVVVDNGSDDGTVELLERRHPAVRLIRFDENRGFAAAVNAGIRAVDTEVVVLLNNDAEPAPDWLEALVSAIDRYPDAASFASRMRSYHERNRVDSAGDRWNLFAYPVGHGEQDGPAFDRPREVFSACAGAAAYRRSALEDVGLFDERFFAFLEDVDIGIRLRAAGWRCRYVPDAVVYHHGSATARRMPEFKLYLLMRNSLYLFFQYKPVWLAAVGAPFMLVWPFYRVLRERRAPRVAARVLRDVVRDAGEILERRRRTRALRGGGSPAVDGGPGRTGRIGTIGARPGDGGDAGREQEP